MAKIAKTADRKKVMDTSKSTDCPKCGKPTRIVKRVKFLFRAQRVSSSRSCRRSLLASSLEPSKNRRNG
jgi:hypothetical protein